MRPRAEPRRPTHPVPAQPHATATTHLAAAWPLGLEPPPAWRGRAGKRRRRRGSCRCDVPNDGDVYAGNSWQRRPAAAAAAAATAGPTADAGMQNGQNEAPERPPRPPPEVAAAVGLLRARSRILQAPSSGSGRWDVPPSPPAAARGVGTVRKLLRRPADIGPKPRPPSADMLEKLVRQKKSGSSAPGPPECSSS
eukprot:365828-Chlamydomonas_euryale.AAC.1